MIIEYWRRITFNFTGDKAPLTGVFVVQVDSTGTPIIEQGSTECNYVNISGDTVKMCEFYNNDLSFSTDTGRGLCSNFVTALENTIYTEIEPSGTWSYVNANKEGYIISAEAGEDGSISPNGEVPVLSGQDQAFTITPSEGYKIASVLVDGTEAKQDLVNNVYTFTNVSTVHTISASFEVLTTYDIEIEMDLTDKDFDFVWGNFLDNITVSGALNIVSSTSDVTTGTGTITITETDILPDNVFQSQTHITSVVLPDCFIEIEDAAFAGCSNMVSITLPDTIEVIGADVFSECTSLTSLELPASVTEVGEGFLDACDSLEEVICLATVPPTTGTTISTLTLPELQVPESSVSAYQNDTVWGGAFTVIKSTTPGPKPVKGYGFNTSGMIDTDYLNEVFIRRN